MTQARHRKWKSEVHTESWKLNSSTATLMRKMEKETGEQPNFKSDKNKYTQGWSYFNSFCVPKKNKCQVLKY